MKNTRLFMFAACTLFLAACGRQTVKIMTPPDASNRVLFGAEQLQTTLDKAGYQVMMQQGDTTFSVPISLNRNSRVVLSLLNISLTR